jgi:quercetin dioxygenase-like cupin family protein
MPDEAPSRGASAGRIVVNEAEAEWTGWPVEEAPRRGDASWKTLISRDRTDSAALTFGLLEMEPGESLRAHRHAQPEIYFVLEGSGAVTVAGEPREVRPGTAVFLPADEVHSIECTGPGRLRLAYVFAADSAGDVDYVFPEDDE